MLLGRSLPQPLWPFGTDGQNPGDLVNAQGYPRHNIEMILSLKLDPSHVPGIGDIFKYEEKTYQGKKYWFPQNEIKVVSNILQWLAFANELTNTSSAARLHDGFFYHEIDVEKCRGGAHNLFRILDEHLYFGELEHRNWVCSNEHPTIADIACFPYIILSEEGGVSRMNYPAIRRWCDRFKRIPGFKVMSGVFRAGPI